jgi:hypothetical protein
MPGYCVPKFNTTWFSGTFNWNEFDGPAYKLYNTTDTIMTAAIATATNTRNLDFFLGERFSINFSIYELAEKGNITVTLTPKASVDPQG